MKKLLVIAVLLVSLQVSAQKPVAPEAAMTAFTKAYPGATKVKWEKEGSNYEVSFMQNGNELSAIYSGKGILQEDEKEIKVSALPAAVLNYMKEHYKGVTVKGAAKITKADGSIQYEAAIKGKDVIFDANGKFLKEAKD